MKLGIYLDPPEGFQGIDWNKEITRYERRLPHWRQDGATYFVTFRLRDSLPQAKLKELKELRENLENEILKYPDLSPFDINRMWEELAKTSLEKTERWLDQGIGDCLFRSGIAQEKVANALLYFHEQRERYRLGAFVVMPNHVHLIVCPLQGDALESILQNRKRKISREINLMLGNSGSLLQEESHDRIVRDRDHLWRCIQYIGKNPRLAELGIGQSRRWINPEWDEIGWRFADEG